MNEQSDQELAELYDEKAQQEIAICQRIYRGLATKEDAQYVLWALGHGTDYSRLI